MRWFANIRIFAADPAHRATVRMIAAVTFELLIMVGLAYWFAFANVWDLRGATWWVDHTLHVPPAAQKPIGDLVDAESQSRAYLLTGDPRYVEAMALIKSRTRRDIANLARLTADNPTQQRNVAKLREIMDRKFAFLEGLNEEFRKRGRDAMYDLTPGRAILIEARDIFEDINDEESRLLVARAAARDRFARNILLWLCLMLVNTLFIFAAVMYGAWQENRSQRFSDG